MKKTVCLILAALLLGSMIIPASAAEAASGSCGDNATWSYRDGTLTISGTGTVSAEYGDSPWQAYIPSITTVVVNEGITKLDDCCFISHQNLVSISLPDSLTVIGAQVFQSCDKLSEVTIPKNVEALGNPRRNPNAADIFSGDGLTNIYVDKANKRYYDIDGVLYDRQEKALLCYPQGKTSTSYTIPDGIKIIQGSAMHFCPVETVILPKSLTTIGDWAFYAARITSIRLPDSVSSIGRNAFTNCDQLVEITVPKAVANLRQDVFGSCEKMEHLTVLNPDCHFAENSSIIGRDVVIHGYMGSTAEQYAKQFGRDFVDIKTGKQYNYCLGNAGYVALLPKDPGGSTPAFNNTMVSDSITGDIVGYQPNLVIVRDKTDPTYREMLAFVQQLTKGCTSDYQKAEKIFNWVNGTMNYQYGNFGMGFTPEGIYQLWKNRDGNCEGYAQLTNFLLHLADIPNATVLGYGHCWNAALVDGRWIMMDVGGYMFDEDPDDMEEILRIDFSVNGNLMCVINDLTGVKLACFGESLLQRHLETELTIPDYIHYFYPTAFEWSNEPLQVIHGTKGSYAEQYLKDQLPAYNDITYDGNTFTAKVGKVWTEDDAILLLRHILFPDLYPMEDARDFTGDGTVTEDDAIMLLRHVLFPDLYPI